MDNSREGLIQRFTNRLFMFKDIGISVETRTDPSNFNEYIDVTINKPIQYKRSVNLMRVFSDPEKEADLLIQQIYSIVDEKNRLNAEIQEKRVVQYEKVANEAFEIFKKKNHDYGDAFAKYGSVGVLVRLEDKIQRCVSISSKNVSLVDDEALRDTLMDLKNYATMAVMLLDEKE